MTAKDFYSSPAQGGYVSHQEMDKPLLPKVREEQIIHALSSNKPNHVAGAVADVKAWIDRDFEIPSSVTDVMVEQLKRADPLSLNVGAPDSEMIKVLNRLGIEIPAYEELPSDDDIPYGD